MERTISAAKIQALMRVTDIHRNEQNYVEGKTTAFCKAGVEWLAAQTEITCEMAVSRFEDTDHFLFMVHLYLPEGLSFHHELIHSESTQKGIAELWERIVDELEALYETHCR